MEREEAAREALSLVNRSTVAMLGTNGDDGYPHIKAVFKMENEGLNALWFSTNTSSRRVAQLRRDARACVYLVDFERIEGLMLVGNVEVLQDIDSKRRLWREGAERYYPSGVTDPDYSVLRFAARWGNYYRALSNVTFEL